MLHRPYDPAVIYAGFTHEEYATFADWQQAAAEATRELVTWVSAHPVRQKGESLPVKNDVYGALKESLKRYFDGKCAYCESEFEAVAWGDVEHYRPKRAVSGVVHAGYYWLAYSASNLMPSCQLCNQGKAKRNQFPIAGLRAHESDDDLDAEQPHLLNPYDVDDCGQNARHLTYVIERDQFTVLPTGRVDGITARGEESVRVYDLNRAALVKRRRKSQKAALHALNATHRTAEFAVCWKDLVSVGQEHAMAVRATCLHWLQAERDRLNAFVGV